MWVIIRGWGMWVITRGGGCGSQLGVGDVGHYN